MEKTYTIKDLATMTGLTERTLRSYIKSGILSGSKADGIWSFTDRDFLSLLADKGAMASIRAKKNALIYDFLLENRKRENEICSILDFHADDVKAHAISSFFCDTINQPTISDIQFSFEQNGDYVRVILKGADTCVMKLLNLYYASFTSSVKLNDRL